MNAYKSADLFDDFIIDRKFDIPSSTVTSRVSPIERALLMIP